MTLEEEKIQFINATKLVLKQRISTNLQTLNNQKDTIVAAYNSLITYVQENYELKDELDKARYDNEVEYIQSKLYECLDKFESDYEIPDEKFSTIVSNQIIVKMTLTNTELLKLASSHINKNYAGDPLGLKSFVDSVNLLYSLASTTELRSFLASFVKTKLEGRARELVLNTDLTVVQIISSLEEGIKPDSSKVVEGRMLALRFSMATQDEFADKTEKLADSFRRALVFEGIPQGKANEMAVDKTVTLCRKNTNSELIKAVLESTKFSTPKEVVASLVTQVDKTKAEHHVLSFRSFHSNRGNDSKNRNRFNPNKKRYNNFPNSNQRGNRPNYRGRGRFNNYNRQNNGNRSQTDNNVRVITEQENRSTPHGTLGDNNNI